MKSVIFYTKISSCFAVFFFFFFLYLLLFLFSCAVAVDSYHATLNFAAVNVTAPVAGGALTTVSAKKVFTSSCLYFFFHLFPPSFRSALRLVLMTAAPLENMRHHLRQDSLLVTNPILVWPRTFHIPTPKSFLSRPMPAKKPASSLALTTVPAIAVNRKS